jgi:hypothetical protein
MIYHGRLASDNLPPAGARRASGSPGSRGATLSESTISGVPRRQEGIRLLQVQRVATVHAVAAEDVRNQLLTHIEEALLAVGAVRIWIDPATTPDFVVMAELPTETPC